MAEVYQLNILRPRQRVSHDRPSARGWFDLISQRFARMSDRIARRWALRRMLRDDLLPQPDSVLADAGWTRTAALREARKPLWTE